MSVYWNAFSVSCILYIRNVSPIYYLGTSQTIGSHPSRLIHLVVSLPPLSCLYHLRDPFDPEVHAQMSLLLFLTPAVLCSPFSRIPVLD